MAADRSGIVDPPDLDGTAGGVVHHSYGGSRCPIDGYREASLDIILPVRRFLGEKELIEADPVQGRIVCEHVGVDVGNCPAFLLG